jgi:hypothetical protein
MDYAANLAFFLLEKTGTVFGRWNGRMAAAEQRALFGRFLGKGKIWIDGANETIEHHVKVCFGLDGECTANLKWAAL